MGLLEMSFQPIIKKVLEKEKSKIEAFINELVALIDKQQAALGYVRWSEEARDRASEAVEGLRKKMIELHAKE